MTTVKITGGTFDHSHFGDNIYHIYLSGQTADELFDFDAFAERVRERLQREASAYVQLDVEPMVSGIGTSLDADHQTLRDAISVERRIVIVAATGSGKTASLRYLASGAPEKEIRAYVELSRYRKLPAVSDLDCLLILIGEVMTDWSSAAKPPSIATLRRLLQERPTMLLFDGLNEVDPSIRGACLRAICDLAFAFEHCRVVFSTRPHGFDPPNGWSAFRLRELTDEQIVQFLRARADDAGVATVLDRFEIEGNPLLRVPLFLTYALRVAHRSPRKLLGSRTGIVAEYVSELFRDRRPLAADEDALTDVLARLAMRLQEVGQSIPLPEAIALLGGDGNLLAALSSSGFLHIDARYVRFWHHTIQEYFFAWGQRRRFARATMLLRREGVRRVLARRADEDALAFLPVVARDDELKTLMLAAVRANISLATRWADDLTIDGRAPEIVAMYLRRVKRRLRNTALYSRLSYERRTGAITAILMVDLIFMFGVADKLKTADALTRNVAVAYAIPWVLGLLLLHYLFTYRGCPDAARIAVHVRNVRSALIRDGVSSAFQTVTRSLFTGYELRQIALLAIRPEHVPEDPLQRLETSATPYLVVQLLGFDESSRAFDVLEAVVDAGAGNVYSRAALQAMLYRAIRDRKAAERLLALATHVWKHGGNWPFRRTAGHCLVALDPRFRPKLRLTRMAHGTLLLLGCAVFFLIFVMTTSGLSTAFLRARGSRADPFDAWAFLILALVPVCSVLMTACAALLRSRRIYGYNGLDAWPPWAYFVWGNIVGFLTSSGVISAIFLPHLMGIYRNGRGLDLVRVRQRVEGLTNEQLQN